ncbi:MAG: hypothetical protein HUU23_00950 [Caldilineales bacterium]|nr:hypothetical protein [Caldilineales bacterium]
MTPTVDNPILNPPDRKPAAFFKLKSPLTPLPCPTATLPNAWSNSWA